MLMPLRLRVSNGRVSCPGRAARVDLEQCLACKSFRGIRSGNIGAGVISCKSEPEELRPDAILYGFFGGYGALRPR